MQSKAISEGNWIKYRHHEGWIATGIVLREHPDGHFIVGDHNTDADPTPVERDDLIEIVE